MLFPYYCMHAWTVLLLDPCMPRDDPPSACPPSLPRLLAVGSGWLSDESLVRSVSRSLDRRELLRGPLFYCLVLISTTLLCWRDSPVGLIAVSMMCGGDGLADIVGRRWGTVKLPYNSSKSYAGSVAMFLGGAVLSAGCVRVCPTTLGSPHHRQLQSMESNALPRQRVCVALPN